MEQLFNIVMFLSLSLPVLSFAGLILLNVFEKEYDYLTLENNKILLEKKLHDMEYMQLSQQIRPHFLFNAINAMLSLTRLGRTEELIDSMESFSMYFRQLYKLKESLIPFEEEFNHTKNYLQIQKSRFGRRLYIEYEIDPDALETYIPPYTLQTLVENAFKHGLEKKSGEKKLVIHLERQGDWVCLKVFDNGNSFTSEAGASGMGLANVRKRLELLFDMTTELKLTRKADWTIAKALWPYSPEEK